MEGDFPDVEEGMRQYLRTETGVNAVVAGRVFFGVPPKGAEFPLLTVRRSGGGDDASDAPVDQAVLQFSCWGGSKQEAWQLTAALRRALHEIRSRTTLASGVDGLGAIVDGVIFSPDPADARPRYIVTARVTATAA